MFSCCVTLLAFSNSLFQDFNCTLSNARSGRIHYRTGDHVAASERMVVIVFCTCTEHPLCELKLANSYCNTFPLFGRFECQYKNKV